MSEVLEIPFDVYDRGQFIEQYQGIDDYRIEILRDEQGKEVKIFALKPNEIIENGEAIINTNYEQEVEKMQLQYQIQELNESIAKLDLKRIRAICEPSLKNEETDETWLDYYNSQIQEKRLQIQELTERINQYDITD